MDKSWIRVKVRRRLFHKRDFQGIDVILDGRKMPSNGELFDSSITIRSKDPNVPSVEVPITVALENSGK